MDWILRARGSSGAAAIFDALTAFILELPVPGVDRTMLAADGLLVTAGERFRIALSTAGGGGSPAFTVAVVLSFKDLSGTVLAVTPVSLTRSSVVWLRTVHATEFVAPVGAVEMEIFLSHVAGGSGAAYDTDILVERLSLAGTAQGEAISTLTTRANAGDDWQGVVSDALTKLGASVDGSTAETLFRMTASATPFGALARIGLMAAASGSEGDARVAALFLDAIAGDQIRVVVQGDAFCILIGASTIPLFIVESGVIRLNAALVKLTGDVEVDNSFKIASDASGDRIEQTRQRIVIYGSGASVIVLGDLTGFV